MAPGQGALIELKFVHSNKSALARGVSWSVLSQLGRQFGTLAITLVLARYLLPDDFGLIGMATVFTGLIGVVNDVGVSGALVQRRDITQKHLSSMFWLNQIVGACLALITLSFASYVADFYSLEKLENVLSVLAIVFCSGALGVVQQTILVRDMNFRRLALIEVTSVIISGVAAVALAVNGFGVWAIVAQMVFVSILTTFGLWVTSSWRPQIVLCSSSIRDLLPFGLNVAGFNILNFVSRNIDYLIIGKFLGAQALGYYTLAYRVMVYPLQSVTHSASRVFFPALSKVSEDRIELEKAYMKMVRGVSIATFPMVFGIFAVSPVFVEVFFGAEWEKTGEVLRVLCLAGLFQSVGATVGPLYQALNRTGVQLRMATVNAILTTFVLLYFSDRGLIELSLAYAVFSSIWVSFSLFVASRIGEFSYVKTWLGLFPIMITSACMAGVVILANQFMRDFGFDGVKALFLQILIGVLAMLILFSMLKVIVWDGLRPKVQFK